MQKKLYIILLILMILSGCVVQNTVSHQVSNLKKDVTDDWEDVEFKNLED